MKQKLFINFNIDIYMNFDISLKKKLDLVHMTNIFII
jgi:hypothetical protein